MGSEADAASFRASADAYDRLMGRYARSLAPAFVAELNLAPDAHVLDVGCGPGALTAALAERVGAERVAAVDPSEPFVEACAARVPGADVRAAAAEDLPHPDAGFDAALSQLVVNFMADAPTGVREMARVTRPGGTVASCVWDYAGEMTMLRTYWDAAIAVDPERATELDEGRRMPYCRPDDLAALWNEAGLGDVRTTDVDARASYTDFEDFWEPFTTGVGPSGSYCVSLDDDLRAALREECARRLGSPDGEFELPARAWMVRGEVPRD
jgi:SAM-dependent methyltransferase